MSQPSQNSGPCWGGILLEVRDGLRDFADFFDAAYSDIYWFLRGRGLQHSDAEDLASEVITSIYTRIAALEADSEREAAAWVYTIARNRCKDHFRRQSRREVETLDADIVDPHNAELLYENVEYVRRQLSRLSDEERELIEMRFVDGMTLAEIAEAKGTTVNVIAGKIYRALRKLRKYAEEDNRE